MDSWGSIQEASTYNRLELVVRVYVPCCNLTVSTMRGHREHRARRQYCFEAGSKVRRLNLDYNPRSTWVRYALCTSNESFEILQALSIIVVVSAFISLFLLAFAIFPLVLSPGGWFVNVSESILL